MNRITLFLLAFGVSLPIIAEEESTYNPISTSVSFLNIAPESRGSAMGDAGVATSPDVYSQYWNPAKYPFINDQFGLGVSYTPWLRSLVNDIGLVDVTGYYRFDKLQTISGSLRYFSMGDIQGTNELGDYTVKITPNELAADLGYSRKFSDHWGGAVVFRYIRSDIFSGYSEGVSAGNSVAADIATYYTNSDEYIGDYPVKYAFGLNISNIGRKLSYNETERYFIPANMKLGASLELKIDDYNSIMGTVDLNKLLVPVSDSTDMSSLSGVFNSFSDAPGGFSEEMDEVMLSVGLEYTYDKTFSVRGGYFYENMYKGNREFFSLGAGFKMNVFSLDVSYLVPMDATSPLANTLRFSLSFGVSGLKNIFAQ